MPSLLVEKIKCDWCSYYDFQDKFPDIWNAPKKYAAVMEKFGNRDYLTFGVGAVCPVCGNYDSFDFDPDRKRLRRSVEGL